VAADHPLGGRAGAALLLAGQPRRALGSGGADRLHGSGAALALGAYGAWDVTLGPGRDESLSGLILIGVPVYQNALFLAGLLIAWLVERRFKSAAV
jgi:hypothetical protein